jgi:hypothetical protein
MKVTFFKNCVISETAMHVVRLCQKWSWGNHRHPNMAICKLMINKHIAIHDGVHWNEISAHGHHIDKMM